MRKSEPKNRRAPGKNRRAHRFHRFMPPDLRWITLWRSRAGPGGRRLPISSTAPQRGHRSTQIAGPRDRAGQGRVTIVIAEQNLLAATPLSYLSRHADQRVSENYRAAQKIG
jgi:hypothetical protein